MKHLIATLALATMGTTAHAAAHWGSVYTDTKTDCITVSQANQKAEIDFAQYECKAFGGYQLSIGGGDLRYAPQLAFAGEYIQLDQPEGFYDMGSTKIEWVYSLTREQDGDGAIEWKGLIYRLNASVQTEDSGEMRNMDILYAVRLDGLKSCPIGMASTNKEARELVYNSKPDCK